MRRRLLFFVVAPVLAVTLVAGLLFTVSSSAQPPALLPETDTVAPPVVLPAVLPTAATATSLPDTPPDTLPATPTVTPAATQVDAQDADLVALVGGEALRLDRFALVQAVDLVMSGLLGTEPATPAQLLEQMINHALVTQQITAAGSALAVDGGARLAALLSAGGKSQADLADSLAAAGVERGQFDEYFAELLAVDGFARQAAQESGSDIDAYIGSLQAGARISYGPAAVAIRNQASDALSIPPSEDTAISASDSPGMTGTANSAVTASVTATVAATVAPERGLSVGQLAPDFTLPGLDQDQEQTAFADLLGTPTVLSFWTTWCPYCLRQTPVLVAEAERHDGDIRFVGINVAEDAAAVAPYVEQHRIPYTILLDRESHAAAAYAVDGYPTTYFLDAAGHIVARHIGSLSTEQLTQYIEQLLDPRS